MYFLNSILICNLISIKIKWTKLELIFCKNLILVSKDPFILVISKFNCASSCVICYIQSFWILTIEFYSHLKLVNLFRCFIMNLGKTCPHCTVCCRMQFLKMKKIVKSMFQSDLFINYCKICILFYFLEFLFICFSG